MAFIRSTSMYDTCDDCGKVLKHSKNIYQEKTLCDDCFVKYLKNESEKKNRNKAKYKVTIVTTKDCVSDKYVYDNVVGGETWRNVYTMYLSDGSTVKFPLFHVDHIVIKEK